MHSAQVLLPLLGKPFIEASRRLVRSRAVDPDCFPFWGSPSLRPLLAAGPRYRCGYARLVDELNPFPRHPQPRARGCALAYTSRRWPTVTSV